MFYSLLKYVVLGPILRALFRPDVTGREHVPEQRPGHPRQQPPELLRLDLHAADGSAKSHLRGESGVLHRQWRQGRLIKAVLRRHRHDPGRPVRRQGRPGRAWTPAWRSCASGELFGIYPEGTRSPDGRLYRGKTGVARLALESGAPVIPVAMLNTDEIQPPGKILPKIRRVRIRFGEPARLRSVRRHGR